MGKLIYQPKGKAREYSPWACNLYNGCTNRCTYCYNRKGVACKLLGKDDVTLKSGLTEESACKLFAKEVTKYREQIIADGKGLFFSFVSDPFLKETWELNCRCAWVANLYYNIESVFLTKIVPSLEMLGILPHSTKIGFTLTGHDELEPGADKNYERIQGMDYVMRLGFKTWASIEPVIDIQSSARMIFDAYDVGCREFKIGLLSGKKDYSPHEVYAFKVFIDSAFGKDCDIQWKHSVLEYIKGLNWTAV